jgi:hypothetical protein
MRSGQSPRLAKKFQHAAEEAGFRGVLAQFVDSEGAHCSVGAEPA